MFPLILFIFLLPSRNFNLSCYILSLTLIPLSPPPAAFLKVITPETLNLRHCLILTTLRFPVLQIESELPLSLQKEKDEEEYHISRSLVFMGVFIYCFRFAREKKTKRKRCRKSVKASKKCFIKNATFRLHFVVKEKKNYDSTPRRRTAVYVPPQKGKRYFVFILILQKASLKSSQDSLFRKVFSIYFCG